MIVNDLFPTPVAFFNLGRDITNKEFNFVKNLEKRENQGNTTSANADVLSSDEMKDISAFVNEKLKFYFQDIHSPAFDVDVYITQSWANYTQKGQYHHKHRHPNSFISGVFYVSADKQKDRIKFFTHRDPQIEIPTNNYNKYNSESWWLSVSSGELVIFPSTLWHMVDTVDADDERISIAFNTFLKGSIGDEISMTGLKL